MRWCELTENDELVTEIYRSEPITNTAAAYDDDRTRLVAREKI